MSQETSNQAATTAAATPPTHLGPALRRAICQPAFMLVAGLLIVAAVVFNVASETLELHFRKLPVPLAKRLDSLPMRLGPWMLVPNDEVLSPDIVEALGTRDYAFLDYVDTRQLTEQELQRLQTLQGTERRRELIRIQLQRPEAVVNLGLTYYTGKADTVAHIPERCYIAGGYEPVTPPEPVKWPIGARLSGAASDQISVRFINFEDQTAARVKQRRSVAYFFHVNGRFEQDPLEVRKRLQNLFERYGYYMKIETMTLVPDPQRSSEVMSDFLVNALPEIARCLPDWQAITSGE